MRYTVLVYVTLVSIQWTRISFSVRENIFCCRPFFCCRSCPRADRTGFECWYQFPNFTLNLTIPVYRRRNSTLPVYRPRRRQQIAREDIWCVGNGPFDRTLLFKGREQIAWKGSENDPRIQKLIWSGSYTVITTSLQRPVKLACPSAFCNQSFAEKKKRHSSSLIAA